MQGKYKVITLCGSTKFKNEFLKVQKALTLQGNIVISLGLFDHSGDENVLTKEAKRMLDAMHKQKIDMADEIFVINVNGYIGSNTKKEIQYAEKNGKKVRYLTTCKDCQNFMGLGDWDLCCKEKHEGYPCGFLCYEDTPVCKKFKSKHDYRDEVGGYHKYGEGWNPHGFFCGECSKESCKDCPDKDMVPF